MLWVNWSLADESGCEYRRRSFKTYAADCEDATGGRGLKQIAAAFGGAQLPLGGAPGGDLLVIAA